MSSATAEIVAEDRSHVGYGLYSGTSDVLSPNISATMDEAWDIGKGRAKRPDGRNAWDVMSECGHDPESGFVVNDYGATNHWPVTFCRECMVVLGPLQPYGEEYGYDLPTPEQQERDKAWREAGWPKDGRP